MNKCRVTRCEDKVTIVYLTICAEGHIDEYRMCKEHAVIMWLQRNVCAYMHPVVDHMAATVKGGEPEDYRFYLGEWVAVEDGKVIGHALKPETLVQYAIDNNHPGTNIFEVKLEHLGR